MLLEVFDAPPADFAPSSNWPPRFHAMTSPNPFWLLTGLLLAPAIRAGDTPRRVVPSTEGTTAIEFDAPENIPDGAYTALAAERVVWLGEMHGSNEAPRLFLGLIRLVARHEAPPVVGLELTHRDQAAIDEFLRTGEAEILATRTFFKSPLKDGRTSRAMARLLRALRTEKIAGVVCFDTSTAESSQARDTEMAERLAQAATQHPRSKLVVLTGSVHSRVTVGMDWDPIFRPAAAELARSIPAIASFNLRYGGGTIWAIMDESNQGREHRLGGWPQEGAHAYSISLGATPVDGHRGIIYSKTLTASSPWQQGD